MTDEIKPEVTPQEQEPKGTSPENPEVEQPKETPEPQATPEEAPEDIDFKKELDKLGTPPKRDEKEKAKFTVQKIYERFPDLQEKEVPLEEDEQESRTLGILLRNQVEGIIRSEVQKMNVKDRESAVKYYLAFYDRVPQTGNIYEDVDSAIWLANKNRTRNALSEMKRTPNDPGIARGAGQRSPLNTAPEIAPKEVQRLVQAGFKKTAPDKWEGERFTLQWNREAKSWEQIEKK